MGAPDVATKAFMMRPDVFVDAFNAGILGGEQVLSADCLEEMDSVVDAQGVGCGLRRNEG